MLSVASVAQAAPTLCSANAAQPDGLTTGDVTFNGLSATDCYGLGTGTATADNIGFTGFTEVASTPAGGSSTGTFGGATFDLTTTTNQILGDWSMSWTGVTGPFTVDLVAVVQTANAFATYFFDNLVLTTSPGKGQWFINFLVQEFTQPLQTFSIYMATNTAPGGGGGGSGGETPPPATDVPEPATIALMAMALLGLGLARRQAVRTRR